MKAKMLSIDAGSQYTSETYKMQLENIMRFRA